MVNIRVIVICIRLFIKLLFFRKSCVEHLKQANIIVPKAKNLVCDFLKEGKYSDF